MYHNDCDCARDQSCHIQCGCECHQRAMAELDMQAILRTNGSVVAIRALALGKDRLAAAARMIRELPGYHGRIECERDAVTGEMLPVRERVTSVRALVSAIGLV